MYKLSKYLVITVFLLLTACTQVETAARLALEAKLVDVLVQSGDPADTVISANLSDYEINRVIEALETYETVRGRWQAIDDGNLAINILLLEDDYQKLVTQYMLVRSIVLAHWEEYTPVQQFVLTGYHERAISLGNAVQASLQSQERRRALSSALELGLILARVVAV